MKRLAIPDAGLCALAEMREWLAGIGTVGGLNCGNKVAPGGVYGIYAKLAALLKRGFP